MKKIGFLLILLQAFSGFAEEPIEKYQFMSFNYPAYSIGMKGSEVWMVKTNDVEQFMIVPGLNGQPGTVSFTSVSKPNHYLRHKNYLLYAEISDNSQLFKNDASFTMRINKFKNAYTAFESSNYPGYFIRHQGYRLKLHKEPTGLLAFATRQLFQKDASFRVVKIAITAEVNQIIKAISLLPKSWSLSVDIKPMGTESGLTSILHATVGGDKLAYGDRIPALWFLSDSTNLKICAPLNGDKDHCFIRETELPLNVFTNIRISQEKLSETKYLYKILISGQQTFKLVNSDAREFKNVKVYVSDPWYKPAKVQIKQLVFGAKPLPTSVPETLVAKNHIIDRISMLRKEWSLSLDIKPISLVSGWTNIMHVTVGSDTKNYGDRVPGIWFLPGTTTLFICSAINGNNNYCYTHKTSLPLNQFTKVRVEQRRLPDQTYQYAIYIGVERVFKIINTDVREFKNVMVYTSDPWYSPAKVQIKNFEFGILILTKGQLVEVIPSLPKVWLFSVDIKPIGVVKQRSNVILATIGKDSERLTDVTPGIWFLRGTTKLHICAPVMQTEFCYTHQTPLPLNEYTNVRIERKQLADQQYMYSIFVHGALVKQMVHGKIQEYQNVMVYASDPWSVPAKVHLRNYVFAERLKRFPLWPSEFKLTSTGPMKGYECVEIKLPIIRNTWMKSHLCQRTGDRIINIGMKWSQTGPIPGMKCTQLVKQPGIINNNNNNYLCVRENAPFNFIWTDAVIGDVEACIPWNDNYLCRSPVMLVTFPDEIDGGQWLKVRHVPAGNKWHRATDQLVGTDVYGTPSDAPSAREWSIRFDNKMFNQFLFATGDGKNWLIAKKEEVIGGLYANEPREILKSSRSNETYTARWYRSALNKEDPWISMTDHHNAITTSEDILYGEDGSTAHTQTVQMHNGADVYIRYKMTGEASCLDEGIVCRTSKCSERKAVVTYYTNDGSLKTCMCACALTEFI